MAKPKQVLSKREKELIISLYKEGKTDKEVAEVLSLKRPAFINILKYNNLTDTIKKVKEEEPDEKVKRSLFERACGYSHPAVKIFCQGAMVTKEDYIEHYPPDTAAAIFWLCNRQRDKWKQTTRVEASVENIPAISFVPVIKKKEGKIDE